MKQIITKIRRVTILTATIAAFFAMENTGKAQFRSGVVSFNVSPQSGTAYFNSMQRSYLQLMQQRQNAYSNYGTAMNLRAAQINAYRNQLESIQKAQQAQYQAYQIRLRMMQQMQGRTMSAGTHSATLHLLHHP